MDDNWWVWVLIALAVIAIIAIIGITMRNRARLKAVQHDRHRAGELREEAEVSGIEASRREADAAAARAEAEEARVAAEQLARQAKQHEQEAGQVRAEAGERLAEADRLDPDLDGRYGPGPRKQRARGRRPRRLWRPDRQRPADGRPAHR